MSKTSGTVPAAAPARLTASTANVVTAKALARTQVRSVFVNQTVTVSTVAVPRLAAAKRAAVAAAA